MILLVASALAGWVPGCEFNYPIAGSAGFSNAQAARQTNRNTYSAAAFAERALVDGGPPFQWVMEWNSTFNAARVPTLCGDEDLGERKQRLYEEPLDLYASNLALTFEAKGVGLFYSASVTQSMLGFRYAAVPTLITQLYPLTAAPLVGVWQRGDGVASYSLDWIGGAHVDTRWFGARAGYTGIGGAYASFDERFLGVFGSTALDFAPGERVTPWTFLRAGLDRFDPAALGGEKVSDAIGLTSFFVRDLPFAEGTAEAAEASGGAKGFPASAKAFTADPKAEGASGGASGGAERLRTLHFEQQNVYGRFDVAFAYALKPRLQVFEGHLAAHSPDYHPGRLTGRARDDEGWLVKAGVVQLPPQYALGVKGGTYVSARAEYSPQEGVYFMALFNDPDQLALYPFATNAVSVRVSVDLEGSY